jgi:hypothetical protein
VPGVAREEVTVADLEGFLDNVPVGRPVLRVDIFDSPETVEAPRVLPITVVYGPCGEQVVRFHGAVSRADVERVTQSEGGGS